MLNFKRILISEYENEYASEYDLNFKDSFSTPKICDYGGDLSKRWYVYFSYLNPKTGKMERQNPIYAGANRYKTKEERLAVLSTYRKVLLRLLREGYSPYADNTVKYRKAAAVKAASATEPEHVKNTDSKEKDNITHKNEEHIESETIKKAFELVLTLKESTLKPTSYRSFKSHVNIFLNWLVNEHPKKTYIHEIERKTVLQFLNQVLKESSARNRNNFRTDLSSTFSLLKENEVVSINVVEDISKLSTVPIKNKPFTQGQQDKIFDYLEKRDPHLLLFIKFVSYNLLRPIEVCRLTLGDLNLEEKTLSYIGKNNKRNTKIIPKILHKTLPDLSGSSNNLLFTINDLGGIWDIKEENRRNYFSNRFKKIVKEHFGYGSEYGLYSFRHASIKKLYNHLCKESSEFIAKSDLMKITGHSSMQALESYLRDIDAQLPEDYSYMF